MKKNGFKNYIAFTIMEMTMVLLLTSIIAAASTPIITSSVSDFSNKNMTPSEAESADAPWRKASGYDGGGIFNSPINTTSPIGIGIRFGNNANSYRYPALLVESRSSNNLFNAPQIKIIQPSQSTYTNIAMDEYENLSIVSGVNSYRVPKSSGQSNYIGSKNVFLGSNIQTYANLSIDDVYYDRSVIVGRDISTRKLVNSVNIGYANSRGVHERNNIVIGQYLGAYASNLTQQGNVQIGKYSWMNYGMNTITIGNYAANHSAEYRDISIGNYAGNNYYLGSIDSFNSYKGDNISIGKYAGAYFLSNSSSDRDNYLQLVFSPNKNVKIGGYAGYVYNNKRSSDNYRVADFNSIFIGEKAGAKLNPAGQPYRRNRSINIGNFSAGYSFNSGGISIGYYSSYDARFWNRNVVIGSYAGYGGNFNYNAIIIGSNKDASVPTAKNANRNSSDNTSYDTNFIAIGSHAGDSSYGQYGSIYIGTYAGQGSGTNGKLYGNVGIGPLTCKNVKGSNKWCLGWGGDITSGSPITLINNVTVWSPTDDTPQMFIGYANGASNGSAAYSNTSITLYANTVYKPSSTTFDILRFSDRRLKTNILPIGDSLEKLRKVNIYDYTLKDDDHKIPQIGVVAQEFRKIFPSDVHTEPNSKKLAVGTDWLIYTMVNAIKEVDKNVQEVQVKFDNYVKDFAGLKSKVAQLEKQAEQIRSENAQIKLRLSKINDKLK